MELARVSSGKLVIRHISDLHSAYFFSLLRETLKTPVNYGVARKDAEGSQEICRIRQFSESPSAYFGREAKSVREMIDFSATSRHDMPNVSK